VAMKLALGVATCEWTGWRECVSSWMRNASYMPNLYIVKHKTVIEAYETIRNNSNHWPVTGYLHDDIICLEEDWDLRVIREFKDPRVGVVGIAGATGHGNPNMRKEPFKISNMVRQNFMSNMANAEENGSRFTGQRDAAVVDGMAIFIRRQVLDKAGGWPQDGTVGYYLYAEWACLMARRLGYTTRLVGVGCNHLSGRSTGLNPGATFDFEGEHRWIFDNFEDVMPWETR
jgi:hypothetical protein